jgi:hypothetical protein
MKPDPCRRFLLEVLDGYHQTAENKHRYGGDCEIQDQPFLRAGLALFVAFDLLVKTLEHGSNLDEHLTPAASQKEGGKYPLLYLFLM